MAIATNEPTQYNTSTTTAYSTSGKSVRPAQPTCIHVQYIMTVTCIPRKIMKKVRESGIQHTVFLKTWFEGSYVNFVLDTEVDVYEEDVLGLISRNGMIDLQHGKYSIHEINLLNLPEVGRAIDKFMANVFDILGLESRDYTKSFDTTWNTHEFNYKECRRSTLYYPLRLSTGGLHLSLSCDAYMRESINTAIVTIVDKFNEQSRRNVGSALLSYNEAQRNHAQALATHNAARTQKKRDQLLATIGGNFTEMSDKQKLLEEARSFKPVSRDNANLFGTNFALTEIE